MQLFISYAHRDRERVRRLVEVLNETGHAPWFDARLVVGRPWQDQLREAIENADAFVYAMSPSSVESEWCQWEFSQAVQIGKPIIPILLEQTDLPKSLGHYQYADFTQGPTAQAIEKLVEGLSGIAVTIAPEHGPHAPSDPQGLPAQAMPRRVWTVPIIIGLVLLAVIAVSLILAVMPSQSRDQLLVQVGLIAPTATSTATPTPTLTPTITPSPTITPTPAPQFVAANEDEILLIVSEFEKRDDNPFNPAIMFDSLQDAVNRARSQHDVPARVERVEFVIRDRERARALADEFSATMVIWGSMDNAGVDTRYEINERVQDRVFSLVESTSFTAQSTSDEVAIRIRRATDQLYVVNFILAQLLYFDGQYLRAAPFFEDAIEIADDIPSEYYAELGLTAAHFYLGYIQQVIAEDNDAALLAYNRSLEIDPESGVALYAFGNRAIILLDQGRHDEAIADYTDALDLNPDHVDAFIGRGWAYHLLGENERAIEDYDAALALDSTLGLAYNDRGISHYDLGNYDAALADYEAALDYGLDEPKWPHNNIGLVYYAQGLYKEAVAQYSSALDLDPDYADALYNRGLAYGEMGNHARAIEDYDRVIAQDSDYVSAFKQRAWTHHLLGNDTQAVEDYDRALLLDPDDGLTYNNRGLSHHTLGNYDEALADYQQAIVLDMENVHWPHNNSGLVHNALGRYETAIEFYDAALEAAPDYADAYNNRGWAYHQLGDDPAAIEDYDRALEIQPDYALVINNRGLSHYSLGDYEAALADYERAVELDFDQIDWTYNLIGLVHFAQNQPDEAIEFYDLAIENNPTYNEALYNRGLAYDALGELDLAIADFTETIELDPVDLAAYISRGNVYTGLEDFENALADYRQAAEIDPDYADAYWGIGNALYDLHRLEEALTNYRRYVELAGDLAADFVLERISELEAEQPVSQPVEKAA